MTTTQTLELLASRVRHHTMTPTERRAQRVSLIMGLRAEDSTLTREKVEEILDAREGSEEHP